MRPTHAPADDRREAGHYEIRLKGHLDARWADWFGGLRITQERDGTTVLRGPVTDQAALHGLLRRVRDLGLPLVSVTHAEPERADAPGDTPGHAPHSDKKRKTR